MKKFSTACPRNCYSTCSFYVNVENDQIISFEPNPANKATPEGICLKGLSYIERTHSKNRILHPLKKDKTGNFVRINWEEAYAVICEKLLYFKAEFGPQSVLFYAGSGMSGTLNSFSYKFWELFGGATITYGNLCWPAGLEAIRLTLGDVKHNAPWDIENARLIIMWGKNPADTNIQQMIPLEKAIEHGAKLVVIDPRRTATADKAHLLLQPTPGTDAALALCLANILIQNQDYDAEFVNHYVLGFEEFKNDIEKYDPEFTSNLTGIPTEYIMQLAKYIGKIKPMTIVPGYGMQRYTNGGQTIRSILSLQIITGNIGKPGACFHYANLQSYVLDEIKEPLSYYPEIAPKPKFRRSISMAKLGIDLIAQKNPSLKMAWIERGNPVAQNPDTNTLVRALQKLDFIVVVEQFMTDTAKEADLILPAKSMFEQTDIIGSYWNPYIQLKPKVIDPPGAVNTELEIYYQLAQKLGYTTDEIQQYLIKPDEDNIIDYLKEKISQVPGLTFEDLQSGPVLAYGNETIAFSDFVFKTPSGKIELLSKQAAEKWDVNSLPEYKPLIEGPLIEKLNNEYPFYLLTPNTKNRIHSQFGNLNAIKSVADDIHVFVNPIDAARYDLSENETIIIYNTRGQLKLSVRFDYSLKRGCVSIINGLWKNEGGPVNLLSAARETDMGYGSAFHDCKVNIRKVED